jgi:hypothetical protein
MDAPAETVAEVREDLARELFIARFNPDQPAGTVRRLPDADFQGAPAIVLEVTPAGGKAFNLYLDPASHLLRGRSYDSQNPITGQPGRAEEVFSEYAATGGVQFPGRETVYMGGQKVVEKVTGQRAVNVGLTPADFRKPQ